MNICWVSTGLQDRFSTAPDGNPITVTGSKLAVRASEIETLVGALTAAAVTDPAASAAVIQLLKGSLETAPGSRNRCRACSTNGK